MGFFFSRLGEIFDQIMMQLCQMDEKTMYVHRIFRLSIDEGGNGFFCLPLRKNLGCLSCFCYIFDIHSGKLT